MTISIVVPLYNEEENVRELHGRLKPVMDSIGKEYEIIFIDDGSTDNTLPLLQDIQTNDDKVIVLSLRRNFGQTAAFAAGFDYSRGDIIVTMDGDLQNDPNDIQRLLELMKDNDLVSGWRKKRKDPFLSRRLPSIIAHSLIIRVTGVNLHDYGGSMKAVLDLITVKFLQSFSTTPLQFFGPIGLLSGALGFLISLYLSVDKLFSGRDIGGRPLLLLGALLIIVGIQFSGPLYSLFKSGLRTHLLYN